MTEVWDEARVQQYINDGTEESLNLDYKAAGALGRSDGKKKEITKDVSAMANSDGGKIIYGISENGHLPGALDPIHRQDFSKEWLEHIVGNIRPKIDGLIIHPVPIDNSNSDVVYVVEIPKSHTAHQATDNRYYKRHNFESVPMEHFEILDVLNRQQHPRIDLEFKLRKNKEGGQRNPPYELEISMANTSNVFAQYVVAQIEMPSKMVHDVGKHGISVPRRQIKPEEVATFRRDNTIQDVVGVDGSYSLRRYGPKRYDPLLPTLKFKTGSIKVSGFVNDGFLHRASIRWTTYADSAPPHSGEVAISNIPIHDGGRIYCLKDLR